MAMHQHGTATSRTTQFRHGDKFPLCYGDKVSRRICHFSFSKSQILLISRRYIFGLGVYIDDVEEPHFEAA